MLKGYGCEVWAYSILRLSSYYFSRLHRYVHFFWPGAVLSVLITVWTSIWCLTVYSVKVIIIKTPSFLFLRFRAMENLVRIALSCGCLACLWLDWMTEARRNSSPKIHHTTLLFKIAPSHLYISLAFRVMSIQPRSVWIEKNKVCVVQYI